MRDHTVTFARPARKDLERLDASVVKRVLAKVESLAQEPRPPGCRKIRTQEGLWRLRVGDYRVIYTVDDDANAVDIVAVRHRREAFR